MSDEKAAPTTQSGVTSFSQADADGIVIRSEFAYVRVRLRDPGGRPRLRVEDLRTHQAIELDAIELESLAWAHHRDLAPLLDPSRTRWISEDEGRYVPTVLAVEGGSHGSNGFAYPEVDLYGVWRHLRPDGG